MGEIISDVERSVVLEDDIEYKLVTVKRRNEGVVSRGFFYGKDILVKNYRSIREGDYLISKRQIVHGANGCVPKSLDNAVVSNEYITIVSNEYVLSEFLMLISKTNSMYRMFFLSSYGVDIEKMVFNVKDWKRRYIWLPCLEEQKKLIDYFKNIENLITLQQRKCDELKEVKKFMLQNMFPQKG